jgi:hypothetical protein
MYLYYQHLGMSSKGRNESLSLLSVVESHKWFLFNVFVKIWLKSKFLILNQLSKHNSLLNKNIFVYQNTKSYCSPSKPTKKLLWLCIYIYTYFRLIQCSIFYYNTIVNVQIKMFLFNKRYISMLTFFSTKLHVQYLHRDYIGYI